MIQMFSGFKKKSDNVDDLISEEIGSGKPPVSSFKSPDMVQKKAKIGSKPNFMMKKTSNANVTGGDLEQSEQKLPSYDDKSPMMGKESSMNRTPPPGPGQSRLTGVKQFSKPMKIQKKKFQMDMPDPKKSGLSPNAAAFANN